MSLTSLEVTPREAPAHRHALAPLKSQNHPPQRILVVEDDSVIRHIYSQVLVRAGYQVDVAEDG